MEKSKKFYGLGYVVADKVEDSYEIEVYPVEVIPTAEGDLSQKDSSSLSIQDSQGNNVAVKYDKSNSIPCTWYPNGEQNRITAPDVCKGDIVEIYTFGETDEYFWCVYSHNQALRKREKVLYYFSNKAGTGGDSTQGYFLLVDTINKTVHFHTANNDGEACGYDLLFNTKEGQLSLSDTFNNSIILNSVEGKLTISTNEKIILNTKDATLNCERAIVNATDKCNINTGTMTIKSKMCYIN